MRIIEDFALCAVSIPGHVRTYPAAIDNEMLFSTAGSSTGKPQLRVLMTIHNTNFEETARCRSPRKLRVQDRIGRTGHV
jgi:hypothetical protein